MEIVKLSSNELVQQTDSALARCEQTMQIWNHSRSGVMLKTMIIGGEHTPMRRMRQVSAEMTRKKQAMCEAKHKVKKKAVRVKMLQRQLETETDDLEIEMLEVRIEELKETISMVEAPYVGAMQEVQELASLHDQLKEQVIEEYGKIDEEVYELEEARYWVKRGFAQAMREVRECGVIKCGNQELLEQIGIDPATALVLIKDYLSSSELSNLSSESTEIFLNEIADKCKELSCDRVKRIGFNPEVITDHLLTMDSEE